MVGGGAVVVGEHTNDCKILRLSVAIVNLRNRMGKERRWQTFCDKCDHNLYFCPVAYSH